MNACRHEAGHAVAIHLLSLAPILRPGGAAVRADGSGIVALDRANTTADAMATLAARLADCKGNEPCAPAVDAARARPDLVPDIIMFMLAGYGAEAETWRGEFARTICVRTSPDFNTARQIVMDMADTTGYAAQVFASEAAREALDRAADWAALPHVRALIDLAAAHLEAHGAASWTELENIFSMHTDTARGGTLTASACVAGKNPLAGIMSATVADVAPSAMVESQRAKWTENKPQESEGYRK